MSFKKLGKAFLCRMLEAQVKRLRRRNDFIIVAVAGSVGKTSTKLAIATMLASRQRVMYQAGNYNDRVTVPLVLFGQTEPGIFNLVAWFRLLLANQRSLRQPYAYDIAVLELGTDGPGQLAKFAYLQPDVVVITAVAPEHMEFFVSLDAVAKEELTPLNFSKQALLNLDDIPGQYLPQTTYRGYGQNKVAEYRLVSSRLHDLQGQQLELKLGAKTPLQVTTPLLGQPGAKIVTAAAGLADMLGWSPSDIQVGLAAIGPVAGRMNILPGANGSVLIDDTYNSSPAAATAALDVIYQAKAKQRICILGSMNELGRSSPAEHRAVGDYCRSDKLDEVITIGAEAEKYLATAAQKNGCKVRSFSSPYAAGAYAKQYLKPGTVILAKGSQNQVFAEEALKLLLQTPSDSSRLVRQSAAWLKLKRQQFPDAEA
jgi:UDP-N-acetylmuramoyl-tripeptide--D-alanyl-D-alanine ligase